MAHSIKPKAVTEFASTSHAHLPRHVHHKEASGLAKAAAARLFRVKAAELASDVATIFSAYVPAFEKVAEEVRRTADLPAAIRHAFPGIKQAQQRKLFDLTVKGSHSLRMRKEAEGDAPQQPSFFARHPRLRDALIIGGGAGLGTVLGGVIGQRHAELLGKPALPMDQFARAHPLPKAIGGGIGGLVGSSLVSGIPDADGEERRRHWLRGALLAGGGGALGGLPGGVLGSGIDSYLNDRNKAAALIPPGLGLSAGAALDAATKGEGHMIGRIMSRGLGNLSPSQAEQGLNALGGTPPFMRGVNAMAGPATRPATLPATLPEFNGLNALGGTPPFMRGVNAMAGPATRPATLPATNKGAGDTTGGGGSGGGMSGNMNMGQSGGATGGAGIGGGLGSDSGGGSAGGGMFAHDMPNLMSAGGGGSGQMFPNTMPSSTPPASGGGGGFSAGQIRSISQGVMDRMQHLDMDPGMAAPGTGGRAMYPGITAPGSLGGGGVGGMAQYLK